MQILGIANSYASAPVNAPTSLSAVEAETSVAISFTAPTNDGGATITNYEYNLNGGSFIALSPADATSPITIGGLTAGTSYTVTLKAVNIVGAGPASAGVAFTTPLPAPTSVEVLAAGGGGSGAGHGGNTFGTYVGHGGGGGGFTTYNASTAVTGGVSYTITVGGQATSSSAVLGATVTGTGGNSAGYGPAGGSGNGNGGTGGDGSGTAGGGGSSAAPTITGISRGHGGGGGGAARRGAGGGGGGGGGGAGGVNSGLVSGGGGYRGGGGGGSANPSYWGGGGAGGGGAGEVIIAYPITFRAATATTGSPSISTVTRAGYRVYIFTGSGTITF